MLFSNDKKRTGWLEEGSDYWRRLKVEVESLRREQVLFRVIKRKIGWKKKVIIGD